MSGHAAANPIRLRRVARVPLPPGILSRVVYSLEWSPDSRRIAVAADGGARVVVIDTASWKVLHSVARMPLHNQHSLGFAAGGREVVTYPMAVRLDRDNPFVFGVFATETGQQLRHAPRPAALPAGDPMPDELAVSPDGQFVALAGRGRVSGNLFLYDVASTALLGAMETPRPTSFLRLAISSRHVLAAERRFHGPEGGPATRKAIMLYELPSLRLLRVLDGHLPFVESMAFSSDGARLLSAAAGMWSAPDPRTGELRLWRDEDPIRIWDVATGQLLASFRARIEPIDSVGWHPSGRLFATLSAKDRDERGSLLQIWPAEGGEPLLRDFMPRGKSIKAARFSPDGALLAWAGDEEIEVHSILEK